MIKVSLPSLTRLHRPALTPDHVGRGDVMAAVDCGPVAGKRTSKRWRRRPGIHRRTDLLSVRSSDAVVGVRLAAASAKTNKRTPRRAAEATAPSTVQLSWVVSLRPRSSSFDPGRRRQSLGLTAAAALRICNITNTRGRLPLMVRRDSGRRSDAGNARSVSRAL